MLKNAEGIINHRWNRIGNSFKSHNNDIRWFSVEEKKVCENSNVHSWAIVFRAVYGFLTHFSNDPLSRCVKKWRIFQEWWFGNVVKNEWVLSLLMINGFLNSWWCINERSCRKKMRDCCLKSTRNFFKKLSLSLPIIDETFWAKFSNTVLVNLEDPREEQELGHTLSPTCRPSDSRLQKSLVACQSLYPALLTAQ